MERFSNVPSASLSVCLVFGRLVLGVSALDLYHDLGLPVGVGIPCPYLRPLAGVWPFPCLPGPRAGRVFAGQLGLTFRVSRGFRLPGASVLTSLLTPASLLVSRGGGSLAPARHSDSSVLRGPYSYSSSLPSGNACRVYSWYLVGCENTSRPYALVFHKMHTGCSLLRFFTRFLSCGSAFCGHRIIKCPLSKQ